MHILHIRKPESIMKELQEIGVDHDAMPLFLKKSYYKIIKMDDLSAAQANILKQTALLCGADLAIPKEAYRGAKKKKFKVILFANHREIEKINARLIEQPWMKGIYNALNEILSDDPSPILKIGNQEIKLQRTYIMGIINITPDSFYSGSRYTTASTVKKVVQEMIREGADFIDIGAESTRPGSEPLSEDEEIDRLKTVLPIAVEHAKVPISVDTYKATVAAFAIDGGAQIINDISGLGFNKRMAKIIARSKANLVIMHIKGKPKTMQVNPQYRNLLAEVNTYLKERLDFAVQSGIEKTRIVIDPGLGFGKNIDDNYEIIERLAELKIFNRPIMVGHSRKSFIGKPFDLAPESRLEGTLGVEALLIQNGASILRVHDVGEAKKVAQLIDRITK